MPLRVPRLLLVGDGPRDAAVLPKLLSALLHAQFEHESRAWARLNHDGGTNGDGRTARGYGRKLLFALRSARANGQDGVVAVVDADRSRNHERLTELKAGRETDRASRAPIPTALGEAIPHNEAWLLDDPVAVRDALRLSRDAVVPSLAAVGSPKEALHELYLQCPRQNEREIDVLPEIAAALDLNRCNARQRTGLQAFADEISAEIRPLFDRVA